MKRTKKLALKAETVRNLNAEELQNINGGYVKTDFCQIGGGGNIYSTELSDGQIQLDAYQYNVLIKAY